MRIDEHLTTREVMLFKIGNISACNGALKENEVLLYPENPDACFDVLQPFMALLGLTVHRIESVIYLDNCILRDGYVFHVKRSWEVVLTYSDEELTHLQEVML